MKKQELLTITGLTSEKFDQMVRRQNATQLIDTDEIPDELANQLIAASGKHKDGRKSQDKQLAGGKETQLAVSNATALAMDESLQDDAVQRGYQAGVTLSRLYGEGVAAGFASGLGEFFDRFTPEVQEVKEEPIEQRLQRLGLQTATQARTKIYQLKPQRPNIEIDSWKLPG